MLAPTLTARLAASRRPLIGMWCSSASPVVAEICAGSGLDLLVVDCEHSPTGLAELLSITRAVASYPITPIVRTPSADVVLIKQYLDLGAQNLLVPMIEGPEQARAMAAAVAYPPEGVRGVGSALARASRWGRVPGYLAAARDTVTLVLQIESARAVDEIDAIARVEGVDALFVGPADLAASLGRLGQPGHPDVVATVERCIAAANAAGRPVGVNCFDLPLARHYLEIGAAFAFVSADVHLLARGSEELAARFHGG